MLRPLFLVPIYLIVKKSKMEKELTQKRVRVDIDALPTHEEIRSCLDKDGYMVIRGVFSERMCEYIYSLFWDYMEGMNPKLKRKDPSTWTNEELPLTTKGLIQQYNAGFQEYSILTHEWMRPIFERVWNTKKLVCSFDGTSFTRKPFKRAQFKNLADWKARAWEKNPVHIDQTTVGFSSVQSGVAIQDQDENGHTFLCIPQSHLYHEELLKLQKVEEENWQIMNEAQLNLLKSKGLEMTRVPMNAGDVVLWRSDVVHASAPYCQDADEKKHRLQVFVSMGPVLESKTERVKESVIRQKAYDQGRVSKHSARRIKLFTRRPRLYSKGHVIQYEKFKIPPSAPMRKKTRLLYGLDVYSDDEE